MADELKVELLGGHADGLQLAVAPDETRLVANFPLTGERIVYARTCLATRAGRTVFRDSRLPS